MLTKKTQVDLTELMQENFTDLDLFREKPFVFKSGKCFLVVAPVTVREHDKFLKHMCKMVLKYYEVFQNLEFLSSSDFKDKETVSRIVKEVNLFNADRNYGKFMKSAEDFIARWAFVTTQQKGNVVLAYEPGNIVSALFLGIKRRHNSYRCRMMLRSIMPDEFIYILFLLFVYNFEIVKKNLVHFLEIFKLEAIGKGKSSKHMAMLKTSEILGLIPEFSAKPYSSEQLDTFARLSTI